MEKRSRSPISVWFEEVPDCRIYAPLQREIEADVVIVGGGIVGLMTAWQLRGGSQRVVLLEKNHLGSGDSGATTGFLSRVPDADLGSLLAKHGAAFVQQLCDRAQAEQRSMFELIRSQKIDCDLASLPSFFGSYEAGDEELKKTWAAVSTLNLDAKLREQKLNPSFPFQQAIEFHHEGAFHILKFLKALAERVSEHCTIFEETEVTAIEHRDPLTIITSSGKIRAKKLLLTVGDPSSLLPEASSLVSGALTFVMNATCDHGLERALYWDTGHPYFYFRPLAEDRVMVGGADVSYDKVHTASAFKKLENFIHDRWGKDARITHAWSGSIFHTSDGLPLVFSPPDSNGRVCCATGFSGNGLVLGPLAARCLADQALGNDNPDARLFALERIDAKLAAPATFSAPTASKDWVGVGSEQEFPEGKLICKTVENREILFCRTDKKIYAMDNRCTHAGGRLCDGTLDGTVVECPLHAGRFDVTSGKVVAAPPIRPEHAYPVRIQNGDVEISISGPEPSTLADDATKPKQRHWRSLLRFLPIPIVFWVVEFAMQYQWFSNHQLGPALIHSFAFSGSTLIAAALLTSAIFKWKPRLAQYWRLRRYLGVSGFVLIALHVFFVFHYLFNYHLSFAFFSFDPIQNPVVFGAAAFIILFLMAATSTDWAAQKLGAKRWKVLHRFVYLAEISAIFHFVFIHPDLLKNPLGVLLVVVMGLAVLGQLFWWVRICAKKKFRTKAVWVGGALILLALVLVILEMRFFRR